jgi:hypothetical protein
MNKHLLKSAEALDEVVRSINRMLEKEFYKSGPNQEGEAKANANQNV